MNEDFRAWLSEQLNRRQWSHSEFSRRSKISRPLISQVLGGDVSPSADFCIKSATTLEASPEMLLRLAGILPPASPVKPGDDTTIQQLIELARTLSPEQRKQLLDFARFLTGQSRD